jgi:hypothetical protein
MTKTIDLFLSHNRADKPWTARLAAAVEADRDGPPLVVFFDDWDISPGSDVPIELEQGLQNSRHVGLVLSPESLASNWVTLERSATIYRDPAARQRSLIPLLRRPCELPDMLARLKYIDFRSEQNFEVGLQQLVAVLRGRHHKRGGDLSTDEFFLREDAALLRQHRRAFDRPAFKVSCIWELFIRELLDAIDDTSAALNTGSLYSRSGRMVSTFPDRNDYRLSEFKEAFSRIAERLTRLKRKVVEFEEAFRRANPTYSHHENFYAMIMSFSRGGNAFDVRNLVALMDLIDDERNAILADLNVLLSRCGEETFEPIELSSSTLKKQQIGGAEEIASMLE